MSATVDDAAEAMLQGMDAQDRETFISLPDGERCGFVRDRMPGETFKVVHAVVDALDHLLHDDFPEWGDYEYDD